MHWIHAFTVDVEDYFQVSAFESDIPRAQWPQWESRVVANTERMLDLLDDAQVKGTFFVLGWIAEQYPDLVRAIDARGHEIASHGFWHRLVYHESPASFRSDIRRTRALLEDLTSKAVFAYRAASFSIVNRSLWALPILAEEGYLVDSSIFPVRHDRYGIPNGHRHLHCIETEQGPLWEFPPTVVRAARYNLPVGGGGYFRLLPWGWTRTCLRQIERKEQRPFMFYIHPWEIDPDQPRVHSHSRLSRFRHYANLRTCEAKLRKLLATFRFGTVTEAMRSAGIALQPSAANARALDPSPQTASAASASTTGVARMPAREPA